MEHFAGNCTSICDDPNISNDLKAACDTGSYNYCAKNAEQNIADPNCKTYLNRVVGNYTAERTGKIYSNPVKFPVGSTVQISNYYNDLGSAVAKYGTKDIGRLTGQSTADLVKILRDNNPNYYTESIATPLVDKALNYCTSASADAVFCSETTPTWVLDTINIKIPGLISDLTTVSGSIIAAYSGSTYIPMHKKFPNTFKPVENLILSKLTKSDLSNPFLVELRTYSPNLQAGIDAFVINLINGKSTFTKEKLESSSLYSINLANNAMLYDLNIQTYLANISKYRAANNITTVDPLVILVANTDASNVQICSTGNPLTTPICTQMSAAGSSVSSSVADITKAYCSTHVSDPKCIEYINSNQTVFNTADINNKMLNYCMTEGINDTVNCKPFSSISGSSDWLKKVTSNVTGTDGTISAVCGTTNGLSKDTCQQVCNMYPEICTADTQQKCSLPTNRYSSNTDYFDGKEDYRTYYGSSRNTSTPNPWLVEHPWISLIILFVVILLFIAIIKASDSNNPFSMYLIMEAFGDIIGALLQAFAG